MSCAGRLAGGRAVQYLSRVTLLALEKLVFSKSQLLNFDSMACNDKYEFEGVPQAKAIQVVPLLMMRTIGLLLFGAAGAPQAHAAFLNNSNGDGRAVGAVPCLSLGRSRVLAPAQPRCPHLQLLGRLFARRSAGPARRVRD